MSLRFEQTSKEKAISILQHEVRQDESPLSILLIFRRFFVVVLLLIGALLPAFRSEAPSCPPNTLSDQRLTDFEFDLFRWAPYKDNQPCAQFRNKMQDNTNDELAKMGTCSLEIDCRRLKRALSCYNAFYSSEDTDPQAQADLDENTTSDLEEICHEYF